MMCYILAQIGVLLLGVMYGIACGMLVLNYGNMLTFKDRIGIVVLVMLCFVHILVGLIQFYFIYVVYKAKKYLKEVILCPYTEYRERGCTTRSNVY
ncbi:hypothetical protein M3Y97_00187200 [Aphelenchoides bicaudatus]|nr:hypothetical protein M3Y97_00187200 [Aphelenchoides bicaudatus]